MDVFDNCRICLQQINHEPIKMTRLIIKFIEKSLQMENVTKPKGGSSTNVKQNLCAGCFNKLSEFQDFHEVCKDADDFWKTKFEIKEIKVAESPAKPEVAITHSEEKMENVTAESLVTTTAQCEVNESQQTIVLTTPIHIDVDDDDVGENEEENPQPENFENMDLNDWPDSNDDGIVNVMDNIEEHNQNEEQKATKDKNNEIIEFEYHIDDSDECGAIINEASVEFPTVGGDFASTYDEIEDDISNDETFTQESMDDIVLENDGTEEHFLMETSIDETGKVKTGYKCQHCDKYFNRIYDIESHYNIHYGVKPYVCNICGKAFRQKNILTTHQTIHFGKKVECKECDKKFARKSQLILHQRMHRGEKPFECGVVGCAAAFRQKQHLIDHSFIHSGVKNFQCTSCDKSFHTRKRLQDHVYKVHSTNRYRCDTCDKAFLKPHMIKNHMLTAHNVEIDDVSHLKTTIEEKKRKKKSNNSSVRETLSPRETAVSQSYPTTFVLTEIE